MIFDEHPGIYPCP